MMILANGPTSILTAIVLVLWALSVVTFVIVAQVARKHLPRGQSENPPGTPPPRPIKGR